MFSQMYPTNCSDPSRAYLHTELLSLCVLIQRPKLLPLFVLGLANLLIPGSRATPEVVAATAAPSLSAVGKGLLSLRESRTAGIGARRGLG